ncbi:MAG: Mu-like prophage major head subunit gpT family protein [Phycisphaerae bacterium]
MGAQGLGSRGIIGKFFAALEIYTGLSWIDLISVLFDSDQESETYKWLGQAPAMREWIGGRHAKGFRENGITIFNKKFEATLNIPVDWMRRDKTGQIDIRIAELAQRAVGHYGKLLSALIYAGTTGLCYDGAEFFAADHEEGESGAQSNLLTKTEVPALEVVLETAPTVEEAIKAILGVIAYMLGYKDDQAEPMNSEARNFLIMTSVSLWPYMVHAVLGEPAEQSNVLKELKKQGFTVSVAANPRLTYTTQFVTFRTDAPAKALIRQEEEKLTMGAKAEGSEYEFDNDQHQYGIKAIRNVGYGYWQYASHATLITKV